MLSLSSVYLLTMLLHSARIMPNYLALDSISHRIWQTTAVIIKGLITSCQKLIISHPLLCHDTHVNNIQCRLNRQHVPYERPSQAECPVSAHTTSGIYQLL